MQVGCPEIKIFSCAEGWNRNQDVVTSEPVLFVLISGTLVQIYGNKPKPNLDVALSWALVRPKLETSVWMGNLVPSEGVPAWGRALERDEL